MGIIRILLFLTAALLTVAPAPAADLQRLVANSPFAPAGSTGQAGAAGPLEFRGVFMDQGEYFFSLYNPATKASVWVGLNEPGQEFFVRSYDEGAQTIVAEFKGRNHALSLSKAPMAAVAQATPAPAPTGTATPTPAVAASADSGEAKRLADLAAEIRRRRALRQQAAPPPGTAAPAPASRPR